MSVQSVARDVPTPEHPRVRVVASHIGEPAGEFADYVNYLCRLGIFRRLGADTFDIPFIPDVMPGFDDSELPDRPDRPALEATPERFRQLIDSQPDLIKHALALYSDVEAARDQMIDVADRDTR